MRYLTFISLLINIMPIVVCTNNTNHVRKLYMDLLANYTKSVMPVYDHQEPLVVDVAFYLASINSFKEVEETISITGSVSLKWTDSTLAWTPALYGYINHTIIDAADIWLPSVVLGNSINKMKPAGSDAKWHALLHSSGMVFYSPADIFNAKCPSDVSQFPFEKQTCSFDFMVWGVPRRLLTLTTSHNKVFLNYFIPNSDWILLEYSTKEITFSLEEPSVYTMIFQIKRRPLYYGVMIIAPTAMFALLNPLVFFLPVESGERVGLAMTILLSYAIFLTLVTDSIPASSNPMSALLIIMMVTILISGIIVCGVIVTVKYHYEDDKNRICPCLKYIVLLNKRYKGYIVEEKKVTGKDVAAMLDWLFLCGSYAVMIIITVAYILYVNI